MKHVKTASGLILLLAVVLVAGVGQAATLTVDGVTYTTIQSALDASANGDTIEITSGTYSESITINTRVTLIGLGTDPDDVIIVNNGGPTLTVGVTGLVAEPIMVENLQIQSDTTQGIVIQSGVAVEYLTLEDVWVMGTNPNDDTENERGLWVPKLSSLNHFTVTDCKFNNLCYGWFIGLNPDGANWDGVGTSFDNVTVTGTEFDSNSAKGLYVEKISNATFTSCLVTNNGSDLGFWNSAWNAGVDLNLKGGDYANLTFSDCTIADNGRGAREGCGLLLKARGTGSDGYTDQPATLDDVDVLYCRITGNERGVRMGEPGKLNTTPTNVVITNCVLVNNEKVYSGSDGSAYGDLVNVCTATIDAENNYWGDADPSDQIGTVAGAGAVDADPVLAISPVAATLTVPGDHSSIQAAINAAIPGDTVSIGAGTYDERPVVNKSLTISGVDESTVIIDAGAAASGSYGFHVTGDNVVITDLTLVGNPAAAAPRYGFKISNVTNPTLQNVTAQEFFRTAVDLLGVTDGVLTDVTSRDNNGHGLALTDCNGVDITNLNSSNNAWSAVSVATWGDYSPLGTSDIVFAGINTFDGLFQLEMGDIDSPGQPPTGDAYITYSTDIADGADVTVQASELAYALHGADDDPTDWDWVWLTPTLADAALVPAAGGLGHFTGDDMFIESLETDGLLHITPGCEIQSAIDYASAGDTIDVAAGTYAEGLTIDKSISILGPNADTSPNTGMRVAEAVLATPAGDHALHGAAANVTFVFKGLTIDMASGAENDRFVEIINQADNTWTLEHNLLINGPSCVNGAWYCSGNNGDLLINLLDNHIYNNDVSNGISLWGNDVNQINIRDNIIEDNAGWGLNLNHAQGTIADNIIRDNDLAGPEWYDDQSGIIVASDNNNLTITGNTFSNLATRALNVYNNFAGGLMVTDNVIDGCQYGAIRIRPDEGAGADLSGTSITGNTFTNNALNIENDSSSSLAAALNWWGTADQGEVLALLTGQIDYSPYLSAAPGTVPMTYIVAPGGDIQAAVDAASSGDTVQILAGTHVLASQILIDENIDLIGAGSDQTVLQAGFNTPGGAYTTTASLIQVASGVTTTIESLAIDGLGYTVRQGIQSRGVDVTVRDCVISNIASTPSSYDGRGIVFLTGTGLVEDCVMSDIYRIGVHIRGNVEPVAPVVTVDGLTYTGKGAGDWLDYGVEFGGGGQGAVTGSTITACLGVASVDGSNSAGILVTDYYGTGTVADITQCSLTGNSVGLHVGYAEDDESDASITNSVIAGNVDFGVVTEGVEVDARNNYWGDPTGPFNALNNPGGLGDEVSDEVLIDPYRTGLFVCDPEPLDLTALATTGTTTVTYLGGYGPVYAYSIDVQWNPAVATAASGDFRKPASGPFADASPFLVQTIGAGHVRIDAGLGGVQAGIDSGPLFDAVFTAASATNAETALTLTVNHVTDFGQQPVVPAVGDVDHGLVRVDTTVPVIAGAQVEDTTISSTAWVKDGDTIDVTATITDTALDIVTCDLTAFGGPAAAVPTDVTDDDYTWTFTPVLIAGADGPVDAIISALDVVGNLTTANATITADNTAPGTLAGVAAMPGHDKIHLSWTDASGLDDNFAGVEFRYTARTEYPEFVNGPATPAADHTDGEFALTETTETTATWAVTAPLERDIYVLAGFVYDHAGNYGPADAVGDENWDAATSYFLGDVVIDYGTPGTYDGDVDIDDITALADVYGQVASSSNAECNVGPTDDWTRFGLPQPDAEIGFFDLLVFSMNYGEVDGSMKSMDAVGDPVLTWTRIDERVWALELVQECAGLKALNVKGDLPSGVTVTVGGGDLVGEQDELVFIGNVDRNGLDAGLAVMGFGQGFQGAGTLLLVTTSQPVEILEIEIDARGLNNEELTADLQTTTDVDIPLVHAIDQNFPNPFNPATTIKFALPQAEDVKLVIYGVDGRLVRTLVSEHRDAGHHEVIWQGNDNAGRRVATGTYFYSIQAGDFHQVRKMSLIK